MDFATARAMYDGEVMVPDLIEGPYWVVEDTYGESTLVPGEVVGGVSSPSDFRDYIKGEPISAELHEGYCAQLHMPGCLDSTDWIGGATVSEVLTDLIEMYPPGE